MRLKEKNYQNRLSFKHKCEIFSPIGGEVGYLRNLIHICNLNDCIIQSAHDQVPVLDILTLNI